MNATLREPWRPRLAIFEPLALTTEVGERVCTNLLRLGSEVLVADRDAAYHRLSQLQEASARSYLLVRARPHRSVRPEFFPGMSTRPHHYFVTLGLNCSFRCEYCYLYSNSARIRPVVIYTHLDETQAQILDALSKSKHALVFNMGEDHDSLALEHLSCTAAEMINFCASIGSRLELRTKSGLVESLLTVTRPQKATIAASLLPQRLTEKYDHGAATVDERLWALKRYASVGYSIALKFEPGLLEGNWRQDYGALIDKAALILGNAAPSHASAGCFRYRRELGEAILRNFPRNALTSDAVTEYVPGRWSYSHEDRRVFYNFLVDRLRRHWSNLPIYLSMESEEMCRGFGAAPWVPFDYQKVRERSLVLPEKAAALGE